MLRFSNHTCSNSVFLFLGHLNTAHISLVKPLFQARKTAGDQVTYFALNQHRVRSINEADQIP